MFGEVHKLLSEFRKFTFPTINFSISMTNSFDHVIFKNMAVLITLGWFYFTKCLFFLIRIMAQHVFRTHMEDCSEKEMKIGPTELESSGELHEPEERIFDAFSEEEEEEPSTFRFKFEYQIPKLDTKFSEDTSNFTNEYNNQSPHEKDICGFLKEESAASFQVHEASSKNEELDTKLLPNEKIEISNVVNDYGFAVNKDFNNPTKESKFCSSLVYESYSKTSEDKVKFEKPIISNYRVSPQKDICGFIENSSTASCRVHLSCHNTIHEDNMEFDKARISNCQLAASEDLSGDNEEPSFATFQVHESSINRSDSNEEVTNSEKPIVSSHQPLPKKDFVICTEESEPMSFQVHETLTAEKVLNSEIMNEDAKGSKSHTSQVHESSIARSDSSEVVTNFEKPVVSSHQSSPKKDFNVLTEEPNAMSFQVHETSIDTTEKQLNSQEMKEDNHGPKLQTFRVRHDFTENTEDDLDHDMLKNDVSEFIEETTTYETYEPTINFEEFFHFDNPIMQTQDVQIGRDQKRKDEVVGSFVDFGSDSDSSFSDSYSVKNLEVDSDNEGFLSEDDFVGDKDSLINSSTFDMELGVEDQTTNSNTKNCSNYANMFDSFFSGKELDKIEKFTKGKLEEYQTFCAENYSPYSENISETESLERELEELNVEDAEGYEIPSTSTVQLELTDSSDDEIPYAKDAEKHLENKMELNESSKYTNGVDMYSEDEDADELESLWEHQDLIEQLKMEIKRVKAIGLPTIFEESEAPKTFEDLKPWKIDAKFLREDPINELHKFYKSYSERMRKLDILNYQKMYAISFLQLKNPLEFMGANKPLIPTLMSCLSQNLSRKKSAIKPSDKFLKELQIELETIYVGQMCLSWEFLRWQYEKIRELPINNLRKQQYNQVAAEFQQFQVVLQRFVENESFQGPRLQNYVQNRCMHRNLLQVPVIKEDCFKDKMEERKKGNGAITREMLEDIIEESISLFWEFVKGDKDETSVIIKGLLRNQTELQDPSDFALMECIQESLQKKEKRLKDVLKTGNCLVKKFKKAREADRTNQDLFFSQVDIKLISRVLKMSYITSDQLVWCHNKLSKITSKNRKIQRESSFLLFPC